MQQYTWFYSFDAEISDEKAQVITTAFSAFLQQWKSHGTPIQGTIQLKYNRFVIIQSQQAEDRPSGCSIDSMKRAVQEILQQADIQCVENSYVFYKDSSNAIVATDFREIPKKIAAGEISADTIVFDHTLSQSDNLELWERPLAETWLKRYLGNKVSL